MPSIELYMAAGSTKKW